MGEGFWASVVDIGSNVYGAIDTALAGILPNFDPGDVGGVTFGGSTPQTGWASSAYTALLGNDTGRVPADEGAKAIADYKAHESLRGKDPDEFVAWESWLSDEKGLSSNDINKWKIGNSDLQIQYADLRTEWSMSNKAPAPGQKAASSSEEDKGFFGEMDLKTSIALAGLVYGIMDRKEQNKKDAEDRDFQDQKFQAELELQRAQLLMNQEEMALRASLESQKLAIQQQQLDQQKGGAAVSRSARNVFSG